MKLPNVWIAEELFDYPYPFLVPDFFHSSNLSKSQVAVLVELISVFTSTIGLEKQFQLDQFFQNYSKISNQQKAKMKEAFLFFIPEFHQKGLIEDRIQLVSSTNSTLIPPILISQFQVSHLSNRFILFEKLLID